MKRLITGFLCLILVCMLCAVSPPPAHAFLSSGGRSGNPALNPKIAMTVRFDYDDMLRVGVAIPAFIHVENSGSAVEGTLRISVTPYRSDQAIAYELPVYLDQGAKADYVLPFRVSNSNESVAVHLIQRNQVVAEAVRNTQPRFTDKMLVGIFSGNQQGMSYWHSFSFIRDKSRTFIDIKTVELDAADFPEEFYLLDRFALLIFNHFDLGYLNEGQVTALVHWVQQGGRLLVDGDPANRQALESLAPIIGLRVDGTQPNPEITEETRDLSSGPDGGFLENLGRIEPAGTVVLGTGDRPLMMEYPVQSGAVFVSSFALDSPGLVSYAEWFPSIPGLSAWGWDTSSQFPISYSAYAERSMAGAASSISWLDAPRLIWIVAVLAVFIILAGPVSYFILKKRDRRDWIWVTAPALSILVCGLIAGYGSFIHGAHTVSSVVTIVDQRDGSSAAQAFSVVGVAAPRQGSYQLAFEEEVFPFRQAERNNYYSSSDAGTPTGRPILHMDMSGYPSATFQQIRQWDMDTLFVRRKVDLEGSLSAQIWYDSGDMFYTVTNGTGTPLEDLVVASSVGYQQIPYLEPGEESSGVFRSYGTYRFVRELYDTSRITPEEEQREAYLRTNVISVMNDYMGLEYQGNTPVIWGWSEEAFALPFSANGKQVKNALNRAVVIGSAKISYERANELSIPSGHIQGVVVDAEDAYVPLGETYAEFYTGQVTFAFSLPELVKEYKLNRFFIFPHEIGGEFNTFLYNCQSGEWEEYELDTILSGDRVQDYISPSGEVLLKIGIDEDADEYVYVSGLDIEVSGKEKADAGN